MIMSNWNGEFDWRNASIQLNQMFGADYLLAVGNDIDSCNTDQSVIYVICI